jgi:excisionase family DNA binding protein
MATAVQMKEAGQDRRFFSLHDLAGVIERDYRTVHRAARAGKIRTVRFGGSLLIPREEFERVLTKGWR